MTHKEKLIKVLQEIGADHSEYGTDYCDNVVVRNDDYDIEERSFTFKFYKETGEYFE
jgi:hypothetical protein